MSVKTPTKMTGEKRSVKYGCRCSSIRRFLMRRPAGENRRPGAGRLLAPVRLRTSTVGVAAASGRGSPIFACRGNRDGPRLRPTRSDAADSTSGSGCGFMGVRRRLEGRGLVGIAQQRRQAVCGSRVSSWDAAVLTLTVHCLPAGIAVVRSEGDDVVRQLPKCPVS